MDSISPNFVFDSDFSQSKTNDCVCEHKAVKCFELCLTDLGYENVTVNLSCISDNQYVIEIGGR